MRKFENQHGAVVESNGLTSFDSLLFLQMKPAGDLESVRNVSAFSQSHLPHKMTVGGRKRSL